MLKAYRTYGSKYFEKVKDLKIGDEVKYLLSNGEIRESEIVGFTLAGNYMLSNGTKFCQDGSSIGVVGRGYAFLVFDDLLIGGE